MVRTPASAAGGRVDVGGPGRRSRRRPARCVDGGVDDRRGRPARGRVLDGAPHRHGAPERVQRQLQRRAEQSPTPSSPGSAPTARSRSTPSPPPTSSSTSPATSRRQRRGAAVAAAAGRHAARRGDVRWPDAGIGVRAAGSTLEVQVAGRAGVPLDASTAVLTDRRRRPARRRLLDRAPHRHGAPQRVQRQLQHGPERRQHRPRPHRQPTARSRSTPTPPPTSSSTSPATCPPASTPRCRPRSASPTPARRHHDRRPARGRRRRARRQQLCRSTSPGAPACPPTRRPRC